MKLSVALLLFVVTLSPAAGQLIKPAADAAQVPRDEGSSPNYFTAVDDKTFFTAYDPVHGRELWRSDGTAEGTRMVADLCPGGCSSFVRPLVTDGNRLYFAWDGQLWTTDGTDYGTTFITRPNSDFRPLAENQAVLLGDKMVFISNDFPFQRVLWVTDGSPEGTFELHIFSSSSGPYDLTVAGDKAFFSSIDDSGKTQLWASDGTLEGTGVVKTLCDGCDASPSNMTALEDRLFFIADDDAHGREPWISDGTTEGTYMLADLLPGSSGSIALNVAVLGNTVYGVLERNCSEADCLFASDGTPEGTAKAPELFPASAAGWPQQVATAGSTLYLKIRDVGESLWTVAGPGGVTQLGSDTNIDLLNHSVSSAGSDGSDTLFYRTRGTTRAFWATDGTPATTRLLMDNLNVVQVAEEQGGRYLLTAQAFVNGKYTDPELWVTDGTAGGAHLLRDLYPPTSSSNPIQLTAWGDDPVWVGEQDGTEKYAVWRLEGSVPTPLVEDAFPYPLAVARNRLFAGTFRHGTLEEPGLWAVEPNGESQPIILSGSPTEMVSFQNELFFAKEPLGQSLWSSDGTQENTELIFDASPDWGGPCQILCPGPVPGPFPDSLTRLDDQLFFVAFESLDGPGQLWATDGTSVGTRVVHEFEMGPNPEQNPVYESPDDLLRVGDWIYFTAFEATTGREVWRTDGTSEGTTLVVDLGEEGSSEEPTLLTSWSYAENLHFAVWIHRSDSGDQLWRSATTWPYGASWISSFNEPGAEVHELIASGEHLYLAVTTPSKGRELWISDGTPGGTYLFDLRKDNPRGSGVANLTAIPDGIFFAAAGPDGEGFEPWVSDGTPRNTFLAADLYPGSSTSDPGPGLLIGDQLYFAADNGETGRELFVLDLDALALGSRGCPADRLCLGQGRFDISMEWQTPDGTSGTAQRVSSTEDSGLMWFFNADNWEAMVKVLDGCDLNGHFWVFAATSTDVGYTLTVEDLLTGKQKSYSNSPGESAAAITDTEALAVCP